MEENMITLNRDNLDGSNWITVSYEYHWNVYYPEDEMNELQEIKNKHKLKGGVGDNGKQYVSYIENPTKEFEEDLAVWLFTRTS